MASESAAAEPNDAVPGCGPLVAATGALVPTTRSTTASSDSRAPGRPTAPWGRASTRPRLSILAILLAWTLVGIAGASPAPAGDPPAPAAPFEPRSPEDALASFVVAPGYRIEPVAAEPLVVAPVALAFDEDGRLWVVEMRGYMPDVSGTGEQEPVGRIVILEDVDDDGRVDTSRVFLDGLVLPRALALTEGGLLYCSPPALTWVDRRGDRPGRSVLIDPDYAREGANPEHRANGLVRALDNWIYNAKSDRAYRRDGDRFLLARIRARGQWGIAQDDSGNLFYNHNSLLLIGDLTPPRWLARHPRLSTNAGTAALGAGNRVFPLLPSDVNRGYLEEVLDESGRLRHATACCGPTIYRGDNFPADARGDAFVPEPAAQLVKRLHVERGPDGGLDASFVYGESEWVASTDPRFRPVNAYTAPDGSIYLLDMYRGVIQHRHYLTDYLRDRSLAKRLEAPLDHGRIWRVVSTARPRGARPRLGSASPRDLVERLAHSNGWWRDTAQRLLVERDAREVLPELEGMVEHSDRTLGRVHALWTLEGLEALRPPLVASALASGDMELTRQAIRVSETLARATDVDLTPVVDELVRLSRDAAADPRTRRALAAVLGRFGGAHEARAHEALIRMLAAAPGDELARELALSGLYGRERPFASRVRESLRDPMRDPMRDPWPDEVRDPATTGAPIDTRVDAEAEGRRALESLAARAESLGGDDSTEATAPRWIDPEGIASLDETDVDARRRDRADSTAPRPDSAEGLDRAESLYRVTCGGCHMPHGRGAPYVAPPLAGSEWLRGPAEVPARIVLGGLRGAVTVDGRRYAVPHYPDHMPGLAGTSTLGDDEIAEILTYVRDRFGDGASPVTPHTVAAIREEVAGRTREYAPTELRRWLGSRMPDNTSFGERARRAERVPAGPDPGAMTIASLFFAAGAIALAGAAIAAIREHRGRRRARSDRSSPRDAA